MPKDKIVWFKYLGTGKLWEWDGMREWNTERSEERCCEEEWQKMSEFVMGGTKYKCSDITPPSLHESELKVSYNSIRHVKTWWWWWRLLLIK